MHAGRRKLAQLDAYQAAQPASVVRAVRPGREIDGLDQIGVDGRAQTAHVVQAGNLHPLNHHPGLFRRRSPDHELARTETGTSHARQVLHHLQGVALRAGNLARLLGADAGFHRLLFDAGRAHDDLLVDVFLLLFHVVLHGALLARPNGFVGEHSDKSRVSDLDLVCASRQIGERKGPGRVGLGGQVQVLDPHGHIGHGLLLESIENHALEVHLWSQ